MTIFEAKLEKWFMQIQSNLKFDQIQQPYCLSNNKIVTELFFFFLRSTMQ